VPATREEVKDALNQLRHRQPRLPLPPPTEEEQGVFTPAEQAAFAFTRKLTFEPHLVGDADIARLCEHYNDSEVAEIVHRVTMAAYFDRPTEAAGLQLED
jgi:alkylhydroperoxidase family enzyme